jgi:flagellar assembly protein FliH
MSSTRFTFDRAFPNTPERFVAVEEREPTITISEHQRLLELATSDARTQGYLDGQNTARDEETARLARAMEAVADSFEHVRHELDAIHATASGEALRFAHAFAMRLAGTVIERYPLASIEQAARSIFDDLRGAPHVAVRVAPDLVEATRDRLQVISRDKGYEGRLIILGEPEIMRGDVRIEWADGGIIRDGAALNQILTSAVEQALTLQPSGQGT